MLCHSFSYPSVFMSGIHYISYSVISLVEAEEPVFSLKCFFVLFCFSSVTFCLISISIQFCGKMEVEPVLPAVLSCQSWSVCVVPG